MSAQSLWPEGRGGLKKDLSKDLREKISLISIFFGYVKQIIAFFSLFVKP
jgi:hypothetical protein